MTGPARAGPRGAGPRGAGPAGPGLVRTRWWWIRHAPVHTSGGRIYGQADLACDCGDAAVFAALARLLPRDAVWVTSHLRRTHETAAALKAALGPGRAGEAAQAPLVVPEFAEQHLGAWQGLDRAAFHAQRPADPSSYWFAAADERPPEGESFVDLVARVRAALDRLNAVCRGRDIVAVAHGGTIRAALTLALGIEPQQALAFAVENCSLTRLDHLEGPSGSGWRVAMVNHQPWS